MGEDKPKVEPTSEMRTAAFACYQTFIALTDGGFTEGQALQIIGAMLGGQRNG